VITYTEDAWTRIEEANLAARWPNDWTTAERDQIEALADDLNRELLEPKPVGSRSSWTRTDIGS
jgi:hypothetical protein